MLFLTGVLKFWGIVLRSGNDAEEYRMGYEKFFNLLKWTEESRDAFK